MTIRTLQKISATLWLFLVLITTKDVCGREDIIMSGSSSTSKQKLTGDHSLGISNTQRHLSIAISDFFLAVSAFNAAYVIFGTAKLGAFGFAVIGTAATFGVLRFASSSPSDQLLHLHDLFAWLAGTIGLSFIAAAVYRSNGQYFMSSALLASSVAVTALTKILAPNVQNIAGQAVSGAAVVSILVFSVLRFNPYGLIGALMYVVSGIIGTRGTLLGVKRVDWFHYALVLGNVALMKAFQQYEPLIFYRPRH